MDGVAAAKWNSGKPVLDAARETAVLEQVTTQAERHGLATEPARALFALQMRLARDWQERRQQQWRTAGGLPAGIAVPDLATQIRPQLDAITATQLLLFARDHADWTETSVLQSAYLAHQNTLLSLTHLPDADREALWTALVALKDAPASALQRVRTTGVLRVGLTGDYAPFSLEHPDGSLSGTDVILAERLADTLAGDGLEGGAVHYIRTTWRTLLPDLIAGKFDVALGGISVTPDRAASAAFSPAYHHGGKTFIARCADGKRYATLALADVPAVRVLVNPGGTNERFVRAQFHHAEIKVVADNRAVFPGLLAADGDLMVTDDVEVALQTRRHPALCRATHLLFEPSIKAVLMRRNPAFEAVVNDWMQRELQAGVPTLLLEKALRQAERSAEAQDPATVQ
jgi:cyclohexadienyl dehydratase